MPDVALAVGRDRLPVPHVVGFHAEHPAPRQSPAAASARG
jgi:hypothetical protein